MNDFICNQCNRKFKSIYALSAHSRSHTGYKPSFENYQCCSIISRKEVGNLNLKKHNQAWLKHLKYCAECGIEFSRQGKFCTRACAGRNFNKNLGAESRNKIRSSNIAIWQDKIEKRWPYSKIVDCKCNVCGGAFVSRYYRKYHKDCYSTYTDYFRAAGFNFNPFNYPLWFDTTSLLKEIEKYGWYCTPGSRKGKRNLNGISRDHLLSRSDGFKLGIEPWKIRHPANMRLIQHNINQRKGSKSIITVCELEKRIAHFNEIYF